MESSLNKTKLTVQGVINPVPAALESEKTGSQSSRSSYCNASNSVAHLAELDDNTTGNIIYKEQWNAENPFRRKSGIPRSPPTTPSVSSQTTPSASSQTTQKVISVIQRKKTTEDKPFEELGNMITGLIEFMKNKSNVHHAIKEQVRAIKAMYNRVKVDGYVTSKTSEFKELSTQTTPNLQSPVEVRQRGRESTETKEISTQTTAKASPPAEGLKRGRERGDMSPKIQRAEKLSKRARELVDSPPKVTKRRKETHQNTKRYNEEVKTVAPQDTNKMNGEQWTIVHRKTKKKKPIMKKQTRTDAMIISAKGESTYADILKKIKADPTLKDLGENVSRIRRTQKGDLLLEIKASSKEIVGNFHDKVKQSIGSQADIRTHKQEICIVCKDIDEVTTKEEICAALRNQFGATDIKETDVKNLRKSYGGTQTAIINLPLDIGRKAILSGKIRIGWVICRVREQLPLKKCFRCLEFGHVATNCTNTHDRSNMCRRCGENGHIAKNCIKNPECMLCRQLEYTDVTHVAGSGRCPVFKKALSKMRQ